MFPHTIKQHTTTKKVSLLKWLFIGVCVLFFNVLTAQDNLDSDALFIAAKKEAFEHKNYPEAIRLTKIALEKTPNYTDLKVFLGRLYTWSDQPKKARETFREVLSQSPSYEDAVVAYANLEYWTNNHTEALRIVNDGLKENPNAERIQTTKAKILISLQRRTEAETLLASILEKNPNASEAKELLNNLKAENTLNEIEASYSFVYFEERYDNPWHIGSLAYTRKTGIGRITGKVNYANRFATGSTQFELEAYPKISKTFYLYTNAGISNDSGIFPKYRAGISLYANILTSFEIDGGFRYLHFSNGTWIYTLGVGTYYKSFWFNLRTYLTPSNDSVSSSYFLTTRYYYGDADDYISLQIGRGVSPDNAANNVLIANDFKITSNRVFLEYRKAFKKTIIFYLQAAFEYVEYTAQDQSNQYTIGAGYIKRF